MRRMRVLLFQLFAAHLARSSNASLLPQPSPNASEPSPSPMPSPDEAKLTILMELAILMEPCGIQGAATTRRMTPWT